MRILMQTTWFGASPENGNLVSDLALALAEQGHDVHVAFLDWTAAYGAAIRTVSFAPRVEVHVLAPRAVRGLGSFVERATKWLGSSVFACWSLRDALKARQFDLEITFSPQTVLLLQTLWSRSMCSTRYLVQWDFFPHHHRQIGLLSNPLAFGVSQRLENWLIQKADIVGCMSPANVAYLRSNFALKTGQSIEILPVWGPTTMPEPADRANIRSRFDLPHDRRIVVFGGALSEGRGLDDILEAGAIAEKTNDNAAFLVIGDGRLSEQVAEAARRYPRTLFYRRRIPRESYLELLTACDVGLVCTVRDVDVPTFPSKTIDYLRAGLPVVASVEDSTDFGAFIESNSLGISVPAGDSVELLAAVRRLPDDQAAKAVARSNARACLHSVFDVQKIARQITAHAREAA